MEIKPKIAVLRTFTQSIASIHPTMEEAHKAAWEWGQHTPSINWSYERLKDSSTLQPGDLYQATDFYVDNERSHLGYSNEIPHMKEVKRSKKGVWRLYQRAVNAVSGHNVQELPPFLILSWRPIDSPCDLGDFVVKSSKEMNLENLWAARHKLGKNWDDGQDQSLNRQARRLARDRFSEVMASI